MIHEPFSGSTVACTKGPGQGGEGAVSWARVR